MHLSTPLHVHRGRHNGDGGNHSHHRTRMGKPLGKCRKRESGGGSGVTTDLLRLALAGLLEFLRDIAKRCPDRRVHPRLVETRNHAPN